MRNPGYGLPWSLDFWPPELILGLGDLLVPLEEDEPAIQAKTLCFHLGNRTPLPSSVIEKEQWIEICRNSDYHSIIDPIGKVHLRPKTEAKRMYDEEVSRRIELALEAM
jgi:hypothetical protein